MPRSPRYNSPGAIRHIILRGNQGRPIFYTDADRIRCCLLLQEGIERFGHRIHAYCLMSNHIHLAWQQGNITIMMKSFLCLAIGGVLMFNQASSLDELQTAPSCVYTTKIAIGSTNPVKIQAVKNATHDEEIDIHPLLVIQS